MRILVLVAAALSILLAQSAHAQEVKARGNNAASMGVSTNSASIGYWHKLNDDNSLGGDFAIIFRDHSHNNSQTYQFSPGIKHYLLPEKSVSPYIYGALVASYGNSSSNQPDYSSRSETYTAGLQGGIGLEWLPIQSMSIAGHVGVMAQYEKNHYSTTSGTVTTFSSGYNEEGFTVSTISSGIHFNLFF